MGSISITVQIKGTKFHWLDLGQMCALLLPGHDITAIKYYTAIVSARPDDRSKPQRQFTYLRALRTRPKVQIVLGNFLTHRVRMPLAVPPLHGPRCVDVIKTEEKGSDVNLATHLLYDAFKNEYDTAVIVSNDSDLLEPIRIVKREFKKVIGIINPRDQQPSKVLVAQADFVKQIRRGLLSACQLPTQLTDAQGEIHKPGKWNSSKITG